MFDLSSFGFGTVTADISKISITGITGYPSGMNTSCNPTNCSTPGGSSGCISIFSTSNPTVADTGLYQIYVYTTTTVFSAGLGGTFSQNDVIDHYYIEILPVPLTYVPDANFEAYLEANGMGNNIPNDSHVFTSAIDTVTYLDVSSQNISDLTGIEDFILLEHLDCYNTPLTSIDISQNTTLTYFRCGNNLLTSLDVSQNTALTSLVCQSNQLTSLDVSQNIALISLTLTSAL